MFLKFKELTVRNGQVSPLQCLFLFATKHASDFTQCLVPPEILVGLNVLAVRCIGYTLGTAAIVRTSGYE